MINKEKKEILQRNTWWKSNQDQKDKDEDQYFLIFIRRVNYYLIFQWNRKTEAYLSLNKKKKKKGHSSTISTWGGWLFSCIIVGGKIERN